MLSIILIFANPTVTVSGQKVSRSLKILVYAIAVVFKNDRELRVGPQDGKTAQSSCPMWLVNNADLSCYEISIEYSRILLARGAGKWDLWAGGSSGV